MIKRYTQAQSPYVFLKNVFETVFGFALPSVGASDLLCALVIIVAIVLGGETQKGAVSDAIVQAASLPLLFLGIRKSEALCTRSGREFSVLICLIVLIPIIQLVPLPVSVWETMPGRDAAVSTLRAANLPQISLPISLSRWSTEQSAIFLIPAVAIYLGSLSCGYEGRRRLWLFVALTAIGCLILQAHQFAEEVGNRFQNDAGPVGSAGFFVNRNHAAAFLYLQIPISAFLYNKYREKGNIIVRVAYIAFNIAIGIGLAMTFSKSAFILGIVAWILTYVFFLRQPNGSTNQISRALIVSITIVVITFIIGLNYGLEIILQRFVRNGVSDEMRSMLSRLSIVVAATYWPLGSGLGTFERVFPLAQDSSTMFAAIVNHAHNDFLELIIETGLLGVSAVLGWCWIVIRSANTIAKEESLSRKRECCLAITVCSLLLIHSSWDYPLRTGALCAVFALACGTLSAAYLASATRSS